MNRGRRIGRIVVHALALVATLLCLLLPKSRYDWVSDIDSTIRPDDLVGGTDDSALVIGAIVVLAIAVEVVAIVTAKSRKEGIVPALLILAVAATWLTR